MIGLLTPLSRFVLLLGLAYLGFYVYGLIMGVFAPGEMVGFGVVALLVIAATGVHFLRLHRATEDPDTRRERIRELHRQRERRGF